MRKLMLLAAVASLGCGNDSTTGPTGPGTPIDPIGATAVLPSDAGRFVATDSAELTYAVGIATAQDGAVYVSDARGNQVVGYRNAVPFVKLVGLAQPLGVAVAGDLLYVGNAGRRDVEVYSLSQQKLVGVLGEGEGEVELPNAIAVAADGVAYVVDSKAHVVRVYGADRALRATIGGKGTAAGQFNFPVGVAVEGDRVAVADQGNHRVQIFDRDGAFVRAFGREFEATSETLDLAGQFTGIWSVAFAPATGDIYVLDAAHAHVQVFDELGVSKGFFGNVGECASCVKLARAIAVDAEGRVFATDPEQHRWVSLSTELR